MADEKKVKPLAEMAFISEIVIQSKIAEMAADQLTKTSDPIEVWGSIQLILVAAANVSKILWPVDKYLSRGKHLRELLGVDDDNMLSKRTFRNHFEHYDDRIEKWFEKSSSAVYIDSEINSFEPTPWSLPRFVHRSYNPSSKMLSFRGESIDVAAVLLALAEVRKKCRPFALP